jgi:hypothetical protein
MIFLVFDLFGRNEKYGYLAYIVALVPINYFWAIGGDPVFTYILLFLLWIATILRDSISVYRDKGKEINEILLYFSLAVLIQLIISAIIPETIPALKVDPIRPYWFFWLPNIHLAEASMALGFKILATVLIILIIIPLLLDIKDEEAPLPIVIVFVVIFVVPFLYLDYVWVGGTPTPVGLLTFLFSVILFIILLLITRSGLETK